VSLESRWREDGRLHQLTIDVPKGNVLNSELMRRLEGAIESVLPARSLRLILINAAGKHFSFGASVEEHRPAQVAQMLTAFHSLIRTIAWSPVPVAALVQGRCLGGAFELALACHFVLASRDAIFACPEIKLGVFPPVLAAIGPLRLGAALTERLLITGGELDAEAAHAAGAVSALLPSGEKLDDQALAWFRRELAEKSAASLRWAVRAARQGAGWSAALGDGLEAAERHYLEEVASSADGREGVEAFLAKRAPRWSAP
jgi:cyclohexa-1,5-dienecarbonyl-CoA hydratase